MSLLSICRNVADETGLNRPQSVIGSNNQTSIRMLRYAIRTGRDLVRKNYPYLFKEHTFTTTATINEYDLPSDFDHFIPFTQWNRTTNRRALQIDPQFWQELNSGLVTVSINDRYRIKGKDRKLFVFPTPTSVETIAFEYVSKNYCERNDGTEQSVWAADTDTAILDEELFELGMIWRVLNRLGMAYAEEKAEYQRIIATAKAQIGQQKIRTDGYRETGTNLPDADFPSS